MVSEKNAIILLSGGLDSATVAAIAQHDGFNLLALTFFYGQRHEIELSYARKLVEFFKIKRHEIIEISPAVFNSALISGSHSAVPKNRDLGTVSDIPATYVPARNILFLSYALAFAESTGSCDIFIGANAVDYSGYPDCRPEFFDSFKKMADTGTKAGQNGRCFNILTPLLYMKKSEIIRTGTQLGVDYSLTHSCYDPHDDGTSCGRCDSCLLRKKGFAEAGIPDPTRYGKNGHQ